MKRIGTINLHLAGAAAEAKPQTLKAAIESAKGEQKEKLASFASALRQPETPEQVATNPEDIYLVPFRLISATTVGSGSWQSTTFTEDVLRQAVNKLLKKPVYIDHSYTVEDAIGTVENAVFTNSFIQDGVAVPAGIDGMLAINTGTSKGLNMAKLIEQGALCSNSVTVQFEWEPSIEVEDEWQFWDNLGRTIDGREVTRNVTNVLDFHETSIVTLGADPYAKKIDANGNLINIDLANKVDPIQLFSKAKTKEEKAEALKQVQGINKYEASFSANPILKKHKAMQEDNKQFAAGFGAELTSLLEGRCESESLEQADLIKEMAEAASISAETVKKHLKGGVACPKASYLAAWAPILNLEVETLIKLAQADGCEYKEEDLKAILEAGNKEDKEEMEDEKKMDCDEDEDDIEGDGMEYSKEKFDAQSKELEDLKALYEAAQESQKKLSAELEAIKSKGLEKQVESLSSQLVDNRKEYKEAISNAARQEAAAKSWTNRFEAISEELDTAKAEKESFAKELQELKADAKFASIGKAHFNEMKKEAKRLYTASQGANANNAVIALFDKVETLEELKGLASQYGKDLSAQFSVQCKDCGSGNCEFGSVVQGYANNEVTEHTEVALTTDALRQNFNLKNK